MELRWNWAQLFVFFRLLDGIQRVAADVGVSLVGNIAPCPPPPFPDLNALFADTLAVFGSQLQQQLHQEVVDRTRTGNISTSFCVEKVNLTSFNDHLENGTPVSLEAICSPTTTAPPSTAATTFTTGNRPSTTVTGVTSTRVVISPSTLPIEATSAAYSKPPPTAVSSARTTQTVTAAERPIPTVNTPPSGQSTKVTDVVGRLTTSSLAEVSPSTTASRETPDTGPQIDGDKKSSPKTTVIAAIVSPLVVVPIVILAGIIIVVYFVRYKRVPLCRKVFECCTLRPSRGADNCYTVTLDNNHNHTNDGGHRARHVARNISELSTSSTVQLVRSDSQLSADDSIDSFNGSQSTLSTPMHSVPMKSYQPALETVGETSTDVAEAPRTAINTDPTHRRAVYPNTVDLSTQHSLPRMGRHGESQYDLPSDNHWPFRCVLPHGAMNNSFGSENYGFAPDRGIDAGNITIVNSSFDEDEGNFYKSVLEKLEDADIMAAELELGSQCLTSGAGPVEATSILQPDTGGIASEPIDAPVQII